MQFDNQKVWDSSFEDQIKCNTYNTAPVDVIVRNVSYHLRARYKNVELENLHFCEIGCGGGINLIWLAEKGIKVSGIDIAPLALELSKKNIESRGLKDSLLSLKHASADSLPFEDSTFDGLIESCVIQHIADQNRDQVFKEIHRVLKPGGLFIGHLLDRDCTAYNAQASSNGSINFQSPHQPKYFLTNIGFTHFFSEEELKKALADFSVVDLSKATFKLPKEEALRRGYQDYLQSMWVVYAIK